MKKAIVLLGAHGVGKDTMADLLFNTRKGVENIKFSEFSKRFVASAISVPYSYLNTGQFRKSYRVASYFGFGSPLTPLDILNVLFQGMASGSESGKRMIDAGIDYAITKADASFLPVFTDIRRQAEYDAVVDNFGKDNTIVVLLQREQAQAVEEGDEGLLELEEHITQTQTLAIITRRTGASVKETFTLLDNYLTENYGL